MFLVMYIAYPDVPVMKSCKSISIYKSFFSCVIDNFKQ